MAFILANTSIRRPHEMDVENSTQTVQHRPLDGSYNRDHFGDNKRIWKLTYRNVQVDEFVTINDIYESYLNTGIEKTWEVTEENYTIDQTTVHVDLNARSFSVGGSSYLSDFTLILTEV